VTERIAAGDEPDAAYAGLNPLYEWALDDLELYDDALARYLGLYQYRPRPC
jgi:hypothetical protein